MVSASAASVRAVEVGADRGLVTVERRLEDPGVGQVLLEVAYCGICGSDLHFRDVPELFPAGTVPGRHGPRVRAAHARRRADALRAARRGR